jgi:hypothetical protein
VEDPECCDRLGFMKPQDIGSTLRLLLRWSARSWELGSTGYGEESDPIYVQILAESATSSDLTTSERVCS